MALVTGGGDDLGCFLRRVGVDASEFTQPHELGSVNVFQGVAASGGVVTDLGPGLSIGAAGDCTGPSCPLWASKSALEYYDIVLLSCEGDPYPASKPSASIQAMHDWLTEGGKILATHSQSIWFEDGAADFQAVAQWAPFSPALSSGTYAIATDFPKGMAFQAWLGTVGAAAGSSIALAGVSQSVGALNPPGIGWILDDAGDASASDASTAGVKYLSFGIPSADAATAGEGGVAGTAYCGKAAFSDIHAGVAPEGDLPDSCQIRPLSTEELALEFLFFDLSACVADDLQVPPPPPPP